LAAGENHRDVTIPSEYKEMWQGALKFFGLEAAVGPKAIMFTGIKTNLKMSDLQGWEVAFCKPYSHPTSMEDFQLPGVAGDSAVLVGARKTGADELLLAAIGRLDVITAKTDNNSTQLHNGIFWCCSPDVRHSFGFWPEDPGHDRPNNPRRLAWNLAPGVGGFCAGSHVDLNGSQEFEKVIMKPSRTMVMHE